MTGDGQDLRSAATAIESWWRAAGVDWVFEDEPRNWLAPAAGNAPPAQPKAAQGRKSAVAEPSPTLVADRSAWPQSLASFGEWWLSEPALDPTGSAHRVPPRGLQGAALMVLVAQPERDDRDRLLSGAQGKLLSAILRALATEDHAAYVASVLPAHVGPIDWAALGGGNMGAALAHHIALVRPQRLLVFGREIVSSLLGNALAHDSPASGCFSHASGEVPLACVAPLEGLLERPARKGSVWRTLLEWTAP